MKMKVFPVWKGGTAYLPNSDMAIARVVRNDGIDNLTQPYQVLVSGSVMHEANTIAKCQAYVTRHVLPKYL